MKTTFCSEYFQKSAKSSGYLSLFSDFLMRQTVFFWVQRVMNRRAEPETYKIKQKQKTNKRNKFLTTIAVPDFVCQRADVGSIKQSTKRFDIRDLIVNFWGGVNSVFKRINCSLVPNMSQKDSLSKNLPWFPQQKYIITHWLLKANHFCSK